MYFRIVLFSVVVSAMFSSPLQKIIIITLSLRPFGTAQIYPRLCSLPMPKMDLTAFQHRMESGTARRVVSSLSEKKELSRRRVGCGGSNQSIALFQALFIKEVSGFQGQV